MIILDVPQGSPEWFKARLGIPTASMFSKIWKPTGGASSQAKDYRMELLAEWLSGEPGSSWKGMDMQAGNFYEPEAGAWYAMNADADTQNVGFVYLDERRNIGCSPDLLVGDDGLAEIKSPAGKTHMKYLLGRELPIKYKPQVQGQLWITQRKWCDFVSYVPSLPAFCIRVERDEQYIGELATAVERFADTLETAKAQLRADGYEPQAD